MYNILLMISKRDDNKSLYRYYCVDNQDGKKVPYSTSSIEELKSTVEDLLWSHNKEEILIIQEMKCDIVVNMNEV